MASCVRARKFAEPPPIRALVAGADRSGQTTVIGAVIVVPQGLSTTDALGQNLQLFAGACRRLRGLKIFILFRGEILVVAILEDRLKHVFERRIWHKLSNSFVCR